LRPATILFLGLTILMAVVIIGSFFAAVKWVNRPFAGFLLYDFPLTGSMSQSDWPGRQAGLEFLDKVVSYDNQEIKAGRDLVEGIGKKMPGTMVQYTIESKDGRRQFTLPVVNFGLRDFFLIFFLTFLGGTAVFVLGCIVYVLKPGVHTSRVFFLYCLFLSLYMVTSFEIQSTYFFVHVHYFALCLMSALLFHLGLIFPERKKILAIWPFLEYLIYLPALILAVGYQIYLFNFNGALGFKFLSTAPAYIRMGKINRMFTLFCVVGMIVFVIRSIFTSASSVGRQRGRMILFGVTLAFLPSVSIMLIMGFLKVNFPWNFLVFFVLFFPASIAYSIVKHNLFDADTIIKRTVGYIVTTGIVIGVYAAVSITLNVLLGRYELTESKAFPILFSLGVILVFNPLRNRIQVLVDRLFFRKEYDYGEVVEKIGGAITSLLDLGQILKQLTRTFKDDMFIDTSSVMLLSAAGTQFQVYLADGEKKQDVEDVVIECQDPLMKVLEDTKKELTKYDMIEDPRFRSISDTCTSNFEALQASLMVPLVFQEKVIGLLILGEKKSGKFYNREDIDLLRTIANQGAVAIKNAAMLEEIIEKERLKTKIMDSFGKYVTSEVRDQILEGRIPLDGELKDVTVLFADLRDFTTMAESNSPKEVVKIINGYFSEMAEAIGENHGLVLQFIGDEIEAVFGAPTALEDHPTHAVRAGLAMRERLISVNEKLEKKGYAPLRHGIGIHTGNVVAANIGSEDRQSYALVGDTVNAASRIQSLNKEYNTDILMSSVTLDRLTESFEGEKLGTTTVKGKKEPLEIFKLF